MAFPWLGTFNRSQFERFVAFAVAQKGQLDARVNHLQAERDRIGSLVMAYDQSGAPIGYEISPKLSYIGKLVSAYEVLGGDVLFDLQVRSQSQAIFLLRGDETRTGRIMSDGSVVAHPGLQDALSADLMLRAKAWVQDTVHYRRDQIERKVRRAIDYSDQLDAEAKALGLIGQTEDTKGSLDYLFKEVRLLLADRNYRAIYDDTGNQARKGDPHGKLTRAPFAPYEPGPDRPVQDYVRTNDGARVPGEET